MKRNSQTCKITRIDWEAAHPTLVQLHANTVLLHRYLPISLYMRTTPLRPPTRLGSLSTSKHCIHIYYRAHYRYTTVLFCTFLLESCALHLQSVFWGICCAVARFRRPEILATVPIHPLGHSNNRNSPPKAFALAFKRFPSTTLFVAW